jgi:hypothetical protein
LRKDLSDHGTFREHQSDENRKMIVAIAANRKIRAAIPHANPKTVTPTTNAVPFLEIGSCDVAAITVKTMPMELIIAHIRPTPNNTTNEPHSLELL